MVCLPLCLLGKRGREGVGQLLRHLGELVQREPAIIVNVTPKESSIDRHLQTFITKQ
jgi:hypothetical protein